MEDLRYCDILGTRINVTDMKQTTDYIISHMDELRGKYICVSNVHTTVMAYEDEEYRNIQNSAAMALPDGAPLSAYSRHYGFEDAQRVTGPDLLLELLKKKKENGKGYRHFFYGSTQETLAAMEREIARAYPDAEVAGMYSPPFREITPAEDAADVAMINEAKPDFIWIGLGAPKQEKWMYEHRGQLCGVSIGVGAGFDFLGGSKKRAPAIMQKLCLEWLYRLIQDPKRLLRRYFTTNLKFFKYILKERHFEHGQKER